MLHAWRYLDWIASQISVSAGTLFAFFTALFLSPFPRIIPQTDSDQRSFSVRDKASIKARKDQDAHFLWLQEESPQALSTIDFGAQPRFQIGALIVQIGRAHV